MNINYNWFSMTVATTAIAITYIVSTGITEHKKVLAMSQAVTEASNKGINPLAIRCAFADSEDNICIVYAAKNPQLQSVKE